MSFTLYPALDIREQRVVRLRQGDYARETRYEETPLALASRYESEGAQWLHLVDLDAARLGGYSLRPLLAALRRETGLRVQTGGGVRAEADVAAILDAGAERVVVGSVAISEPSRVRAWLQRFGAERLVLALDVRRDAEGRWRLPLRGWTVDSGLELAEVLQAYEGAGLRHLLCTDIERDGMLSGTNAALYAHLLTLAPGLQVQASGGARGLEDAQAAREAGCAGIVFGKALLEGRFSLPEALAEAAC
jgi:phosphoribosylformimino-5-aminoimidazole carboxamide ribotide isomerase